MSIDIPVAILCGGRGTRLGALTANTPKSLVKVAGRPFLEHQLDLLKRQGVKYVTLLVGHLWEQIRDWAVQHPDDGVSVSWIIEESPLGQLGAVQNAAKWLPDEFLTIYGDSYLPDLDLAALVAQGRKNKRTTQAIWNGVEFGMDYGVTYWRSELLPHLEGASISSLTHNGLADPYIVEKKFLQIGDPAGLAEVEWVLSQREEFADKFLREVTQIADLLDREKINAIAEHLAMLRERNGRLFVLGVGGSAANASHAVNDFRKISGIEAYAPTDNMAEFSARVNDNGFRDTFAGWLRVSKMGPMDALLVLSVGGATDVAPGTSVNIAYAVQEANRVGTIVLGIVGRDGGYTLRNSTACLLIPTVNADHITPHAESFQAVVWHLIVNHPRLRK